MTVMFVSDVVGVATAEARMAFLISSAEAAGFSDAYSATAPATCGVAIDVPLKEL